MQTEPRAPKPRAQPLETDCRSAPGEPDRRPAQTASPGAGRGDIPWGRKRQALPIEQTLRLRSIELTDIDTRWCGVERVIKEMAAIGKELRRLVRRLPPSPAASLRRPDHRLQRRGRFPLLPPDAKREWCRPGSTSAGTEGNGCHDTERSILDIDLLELVVSRGKERDSSTVRCPERRRGTVGAG